MFKPGDLVRLIGQPVVMTVIDLSRDQVGCGWFNIHDEMQEKWISPKCLAQVLPEAEPILTDKELEVLSEIRRPAGVYGRRN
jgi:hypothetical protein